MKILITGICGFVGGALARALLESSEKLEIFGVDNFIRPGSELNRRELARLGVKIIHADIRSAADFETLPAADFVVDAAANPSVLAGVDGKTSSRQLLEHNLWGTVNLLEYCKAHRAGLILLSTSRVYSVPPLAALPAEVFQKAFRPKPGAKLPDGLAAAGVSEKFSTAPPISLYGSSKLASEAIALEYGETFNFPVWINRCGVLAGAGQFGKADQGIFSFWLNAHLRRRPLKYIGFDGGGHQVRDCLHPRDLVPALRAQMKNNGKEKPRIANFSGGAANAMSLAQLTDWCDARFGKHTVAGDANPRPFDIPWMVLDSSLAEKTWNWSPKILLPQVLEEIAKHAEQNPDWLEISGS
ncbi:MAG TPA: NAD-dependent epimerase/dehydratase family protein [Verrucomicrobiae bacterium]|jgi:CDP-paratose 2-epimerase